MGNLHVKDGREEMRNQGSGKFAVLHLRFDKVWYFLGEMTSMIFFFRSENTKKCLSFHPVTKKIRLLSKLQAQLSKCMRLFTILLFLFPKIPSPCSHIYPHPNANQQWTNPSLLSHTTLPPTATVSGHSSSPLQCRLKATQPRFVSIAPSSSRIVSMSQGLSHCHAWWASIRGHLWHSGLVWKMGETSMINKNNDMQHQMRRCNSPLL